MRTKKTLVLIPLIFLTLISMTDFIYSTGTDRLDQSDDPPIIPVGLDAYRMWDRLAYHRIGIRAYMRSTYDREGNNRSADASHFLYQESDDFNVTLDVQGPGVLYFKRTNRWHGSPWHYEVDGEDFIVKETATADPVNARKTLKHTIFIPENLFPEPLVWTWPTTKGADLMWVPLTFERSFRIAYTRTFYGTGYYIYHIFPPGIENISKPIKSWDKTPPDPEVLDLLNRAGTDIAPQGEDVKKISGKLKIKPFEWITLAEIEEAPSSIRAFKLTVPRDQAYDFGKCRLRITWDNRWHASVDSPVDLFFGAGHIYNKNDGEYLVKGFPLNIRFDEKNVYLSCYWPMPFFRQARIEIQDRQGLNFSGIRWEIRTIPFTDPINHVGYFHATYSDHPEPKKGQDIIFLDTSNAEGGGVWSGNFVGMSWIFTRDGYLRTLEADPRFFFDDSRTPQAWGTGTEEWGGGGSFWDQGHNTTLPLAGHPLGCKDIDAQNENDLLNSAYRFLIADIFPFGRRAVIGLEHGGTNLSEEHYSGVVYWYGIDSPSLVLTDRLNTCDDTDITEHEYESPNASEPEVLISRYEWGPDHHGAQMNFPAEQDQTRTMKGTSRFKVKLDPGNLGVLLRRKFDYLYPNQRADVWVKPDRPDAEWEYVGQWYTAGSNTCVYSYPREEGELGQTQHNIITSNRRWREEEFLIPRHLTEGVERLAIKILHIPDAKELFPGQPFPAESAWSESRYWAYCYKMPKVKLRAEIK